jgi:hypothetical protein
MVMLKSVILLAYLLFNGGIFDIAGVTVNTSRIRSDNQEQYLEAEPVMRLCNQFEKNPLLKGVKGSFEEIRANEKYHPNDAIIQVSSNGRYLQWSNGVPIYINADTGWSLTRDYTPEEVVEYLEITREQKFNVVQMSAVFHEVIPNQDIIGPAFYDGDFTRPRQDYWNQVDWVVHEATSRGMIVMINPIWKKQHSKTIQNNGVEKCRAYGKWFAERYKDNPYVIYFVGGDAVPEPVKDELAAMAKGIQDVYNGKAIIAVHSRQTTSSLEVYPEQPDWLTLNWTYAYSPLRADWNLWPYEHNHRNYQQFYLRNYQQLQPVPIQFGEGYYDFGAVRELGSTDVDDRFGGRYALRRQAWYASFLTGSTGHAYGAEAIWNHNRDGETWQMALQYDSRKDMTIKKLLVDDIPWWTMIPDINHKFLVCGFGIRGTGEFAVAAVSSDRKLAVIYTPVYNELQLNLDELAEGLITVEWYDPCTGEIKPAERSSITARGKIILCSPATNSCGKSDYVLLVKVENKNSVH